jgi:hypothetical protein
VTTEVESPLNVGFISIVLANHLKDVGLPKNDIGNVKVTKLPVILKVYMIPANGHPSR